MDTRTSSGRAPFRSSLCKRSYGRRMAPDLADDTAGSPRWTQTDGERARDIERHLLSAVDWLSVGWAAEGLSTEEHGLLLLCALELGRHAGAHPLRPLCRDTRAGRSRAKSDSGDHRQPKRQSSAKRGAFIDAQGYDAGKKVTGRKRHILVDTLGLLLSVAVHSADIQDRDGAALVLDPRTRALFPFILRIFADAGYQGARAALAAASTGNWISRSSNATSCTNSSSCQNAGLWSAPSPGSAAIAGWRVITSAMQEPSSATSDLQ